VCVLKRDGLLYRQTDHGSSFAQKTRIRRGNSGTAAVLGAATEETEPETSVEKELSLITIHYTLL